MDREFISNVIGNIDERFVAEALLPFESHGENNDSSNHHASLKGMNVDIQGQSEPSEGYKK